MKTKDRIKRFMNRFMNLYMNNRIPMSSAALSYYLTMTFFPLVICLYTLLGNSYEKALKVVGFIETVMPERTVEMLKSFLDYVSANYSVLMMVFALSVILITSSAAFRSLENTIGVMQGGRRFDGYAFFVVSIFLSLGFLATIYMATIVMFLGENFISFINGYIKIIQLDNYWRFLRFIILFGIALVIIVLIYELCKRKEDHYRTFPGALFATLLLVAVTAFFSMFINASIKYPLVYSSLSAVILLMFWLYCCCLVIYCGAVFNIARRDIRNEEETTKD